MPLILSSGCAIMLAKFLEDEFLKRRGVDLYIDLTDWAKEIGLPYNTLRGMMRNRSKDPGINSKNLARLVQYFGPPFLEAIGSPIPENPKNPLYNAEPRFAGIMSEGKPEFIIKKGG